MNRSIVLAVVAAAFGLAACSTGDASEAPANTVSATSTATQTPVSPPSSTVTEVVTETVTKPVAPVSTKPVISSFGYGDLKLGMTRQQAIDAKLISPIEGGQPADVCTLHRINGTKGTTWISNKLGVASITFYPEMSSDGVGIGATEAKLKSEYTNLVKVGPNYTWSAKADNNPQAGFAFGVNNDKVVTAAILSLNNQDCHN